VNWHGVVEMFLNNPKNQCDDDPLDECYISGGFQGLTHFFEAGGWWLAATKPCNQLSLTAYVNVCIWQRYAYT